MNNYQYMKISQQYFIDEIRSEYDIEKLVHNGYIFMEIRKGMYGLKKAGIIDFNRLVEILALAGYHLIKHINRLWKHKTRNIMFTLVVDDFGIKYSNIEDMQHRL